MGKEEIERIEDILKEHIDKYGPMLKYVDIPTRSGRLSILTPSGKEFLDNMIQEMLYRG